MSNLYRNKRFFSDLNFSQELGGGAEVRKRSKYEGKSREIMRIKESWWNDKKNDEFRVVWSV